MSRPEFVDARTGEPLSGKISDRLRKVLTRVQSTYARIVRGEWVEDSQQDPRSRLVTWGRR